MTAVTNPVAPKKKAVRELKNLRTPAGNQRAVAFCHRCHRCHGCHVARLGHGK